jgi:hypothetical protein
MDITLRDQLVVGEQVLFRQLQNEAVLLDLKSGTYFGLNDVGARAWQLMAEHRCLSEVLDALLEEYAVERALAEHDLLALAGQLVTRKLADVRHGG